MDGLERRSCGIDRKLGWTSVNANLHVGPLWEAFNIKVRSPEKFMEVSVVKVSDVDGLLSLDMTITAKTTVWKERISNRVVSVIVF